MPSAHRDPTDVALGGEREGHARVREAGVAGVATSLPPNGRVAACIGLVEFVL